MEQYPDWMTHGKYRTVIQGSGCNTDTAVHPGIVYFRNLELRTSDIAQRVKVLATKPEDLSLILGTHMTEGQK